MFAKEKSKPVETVLGPETNIKGNITTKGTLRIDGVLEGEINAEGVIVGESGQILGNIIAKTVVIGGKVNGNVTAENSLEILPKGQLFGDINSSKLTIAEGAVFEGTSTMISKEPKIIDVKELIKS